MDGKSKLALVIVLHTLAIVLAYAALFAFGRAEEETDWRFWLACGPFFLQVVWGYSASGWKEFAAFVLAVFAVDMIFAGAFWLFLGEIVTPMIGDGEDLFDDDLHRVFTVVLASLIPAFVMLSLGCLIGASKRFITRARTPDLKP